MTHALSESYRVTGRTVFARERVGLRYEKRTELACSKGVKGAEAARLLFIDAERLIFA